MTTREKLLQELTDTSDEILIPVLKFLQLLKSYPQAGDEFNSILADTFKVLEQQSSYEQWLMITQKKVAVALEQVERGEILDGELVITQLQEKIERMRPSST